MVFIGLPYPHPPGSSKKKTAKHPQSHRWNCGKSAHTALAVKACLLGGNSNTKCSMTFVNIAVAISALAGGGGPKTISHGAQISHRDQNTPFMLKTSSETTFYDFLRPSKQKLWKNPRFLTSPRCNSAPPKGPKPCKKRCFWTQGAKSTVNYRVISWQGAKSSKNVENGPRSPTYPEPMPNIAPKLAQHRAHIGKPRPNRGQHRPNIGATSAKIGQHRPNIGQHRRNMGPTKTPDGPKMGPRWAQHSPTWAEHGPKMAQHGTTWHNISPRWAHDGVTWHDISLRWAQDGSAWARRPRRRRRQPRRQPPPPPPPRGVHNRALLFSVYELK